MRGRPQDPAPPRAGFRRVAPHVLGLGLLLASAAWGCAVRTGLEDRRPPAPPPPAPIDLHEPGQVEPASPPAAPDFPREAPEGIFHRVGPGETLWRIARAYGLAWEELASVNGIRDPRSLEAGQSLFVPGATAPRRIAPFPAPPPLPPPPVAPPRPTPGAGADDGYVWPLPGAEVLSAFGASRGRRRHSGVDIRGTAGETIVASAPGTVSFAGSRSGYGRTVIVDHGGGIESLYAHNSALLVREGDTVGRGQPIARVGRTGNATTDHCHFEIRVDGRPVNPLAFLPPRGTVAAPDGIASGAPGLARTAGDESAAPP